MCPIFVDFIGEVPGEKPLERRRDQLRELLLT